MTEAAVTFLLEKVELTVRHYASLLGDAKDELQQLKVELDRLKSFLEDAGRQKQKDARFRQLEKEIRSAVYEAEDTIDSSLTKKVAANNRKWYKKVVHLGKGVKLAEGVKEMREKIAPLIDRAEKERGNGSAGGGEQSLHKEKPIRTIRQDNVIGFDEEEQTIINYLMEPKKELDVISIIGMPGLGKTTLAMKVFENSQIKSKFATRIWVSVSEEFSEKEVLLNILKEFTKQDLSSLSEHHLCQEVRCKLEDGRFLLVLDDVWSVETWKVIKNVLPSKNAEGKVLITSRDKPVGVRANPRRQPHMLSFLSPEHSWELLQLEVYGSTDGCPKDLEEIGRQIATECNGLPLAILVIGGILLDHKAGSLAEIKRAWTEVSKDVSAYYRENIEANNILEVVASSYNRLPDKLKECFLYLGVFPEDYAIPVRALIHLWIAEGFIKHGEKKGLEETGKDNLDDLIDRNLVMVHKTTPYGKLKLCKVHDVIREFCKSKAGLEEQNLFQEIKKNKQKVFHPPLSTIAKLRRLCIHVDVLDLINKLNRGKIDRGYLRSFLCFCKDSFALDGKLIFAIRENLHLLRVLDSKSFKFAEFPKDLTKLIHLRYITLSCDELPFLPESMSELKSLQTLFVYTMSRTLRIKANIWELQQLRHLMTKASIILEVQKQGKSREKNEDDEAGKNLQTLNRLSPECCTKDVFNRAQNLNKLGILGNLASLLDNDPSLKDLECLENLKLVHVTPASDKQLDEKDFFFHRLPIENFFPKNITRLTLSYIYLDSKHMSMLGKIETLEVLKLKNNDFTGQLWYFSGGFPSLLFLLIATTNLVKWEEEREASSDTNHFPSLSCLVLEQCTELSKIPKFMAKTLLTLDINSVSQTAIDSAEEIGKEAVKQGFKLTVDHQLKLKK